MAWASGFTGTGGGCYLLIGGAAVCAFAASCVAIFTFFYSFLFFLAFFHSSLRQSDHAF